MSEEQKSETPPPADTTKDDQFKTFEKKFDSFIDIIGDAVSQPKQAAAPEPKAESVSKEEIDEAGFDDRQLGVIGKLVSSAVTAAVGEAKKEGAVMTEQGRYDAMAYKKFPDLKNPNSQFYKLSESIIKRRESYDPSIRKRPDLLWTIGNEAEEAVKATTENNNYSSNNAPRNRGADASFLEGSRSSGGVTKNSNNNEISEDRKWVRSKLGIS